MLKLYRKLQNLRCPECDAVQPPFLLVGTFKSGLRPGPVNEWAMCLDCAAKLKLVSRFGPISTAAWQILFGVFGAILFFAILLSFLGASLETFGARGLLLWPILMLGFLYLQSFLMGYISPFYREVKII